MNIQLKYFLMIISLFSVLLVPNSTSAEEDIFTIINEKYPDEIKILNKYGASNDDIKIFISDLESKLLNKDVLSGDTAADVLFVMYLKNSNPNFFDALNNGWNLSLSKLSNQYSSGGLEAVKSLFPRSFFEMGSLVRDNIYEKYFIDLPINQYTYDINRDGLIDDIDVNMAQLYYMDLYDVPNKYPAVYTDGNKLNTTRPSESRFLYDINRDGFIDDIDVNMVQLYYMDLYQVKETYPAIFLDL